MIHKQEKYQTLEKDTEMTERMELADKMLEQLAIKT